MKKIARKSPSHLRKAPKNASSPQYLSLRRKRESYLSLMTLSMALRRTGDIAETAGAIPFNPYQATGNAAYPKLCLRWMATTTARCPRRAAQRDREREQPMSDKIEELDRAMRGEVEDLIKRVTTLLPRDDAIVFLYGMAEHATQAMSALEDDASNARQDIIDGLADGARHT
jgi:hypothetical protein